MYTIYYGTNNLAKINHMKKICENSSINIIGINEIKNIDHNINESGKEPLDNARIKALHYYKQISKPVFSIDSGLFFENIENKDQPGTFIRRINGRYLDDKGMIEHYSKLANKYGGEIIGYYKNAICIIINYETIIENDSELINSERFILSSIPHKKLVEGWPLDSLSKDIKSGKYCYDIELIDNNIHAIIGIKAEREYLNILNELINKKRYVT
jgi:8-oxo-dGTP diphosphatase